MNCTENLLRRRAVETVNGWTKINKKNGETGRVIALGNRVNCNGEMMENLTIKKNLDNLVEKYKLNNYEINKIQSEYTVGYELIITEEDYNTLVNLFKKI